MKFNIMAGTHSAEATFDVGADGKVTGIISSAIGVGVISSGVRQGDTMTGEISFQGHKGKFSAQLEGDKISGTIEVPFPLSLVVPDKFAGTLAA